MPYRFAFTVAFLLLVAPRLAHGAPQLPYSVERCPVAGVDLDRSAAPRGPDIHPNAIGYAVIAGAFARSIGRL